jgi:hypothetical protein
LKEVQFNDQDCIAFNVEILLPLDDSEGEGTNYKRETIAVRRNDGSIVSALTYRVRNPQQDLKTNLEYVGYIVEGLGDQGVQEDYLEIVKNLPRQKTTNRRAMTPTPFGRRWNYVSGMKEDWLSS